MRRMLKGLFETTTLLALAVFLSILLAKWGEPQSVWLWCEVLGLDKLCQ